MTAVNNIPLPARIYPSNGAVNRIHINEAWRFYLVVLVRSKLEISGILPFCFAGGNIGKQVSLRFWDANFRCHDCANVDDEDEMKLCVEYPSLKHGLPSGLLGVFVDNQLKLRDQLESLFKSKSTDATDPRILSPSMRRSRS